MTLNLEQIKEIIPHRDPFLLIDEVTELEPGVSVTAKKYLKPDEYWFKGHFPGQPVQPGVLMIEMLAQAGAVCALSLPENKGKIAFFAGIDKARFRGTGSSRRHPGASRHNDKEEGSDRLRRRRCHRQRQEGSHR